MRLMRFFLASLLAAGLASNSAFRSAGQNWTPTSAPFTNWASLACSADGSKLVAAIGGVGPFWPAGPIYASTNSGITWSLSSAPLTNWSAVASSADGTRLVASVYTYYFPDPIYASTDSGASWSPSGAPSTNKWVFLASAADGQTLLAAFERFGHVPGGILTSLDAGSSWTQPLGDWQQWPAVACSANGTKMAATSGSGGIFISTNSGAAWTSTNSPLNGSSALALSADGSKLVTAGPGGSIYLSTDLGATWNATTAPSSNWCCVACSADGTKLVAAGGNRDGSYPPGSVYTSTNSGVTWAVANLPVANWVSVASSADGSRLFAADSGGGIYTAQTTPTPLLNIIQSRDNLLLSWIVPSLSFVLQKSSGLSVANWTDVTVTPTLDLANLQYQVALSKPPGTVFYRLVSSQVDP